MWKCTVILAVIKSLFELNYYKLKMVTEHFFIVLQLFSASYKQNQIKKTGIGFGHEQTDRVEKRME